MVLTAVVIVDVPAALLVPAPVLVVITFLPVGAGCGRGNNFMY